MINYQPLKTLFEFGSIPIHSYSLMLAIAFIVGTLIAIKQARRFGLDERHILNIAPLIIIGAFIGSVLFEPLLFLASTIRNIKEIDILWRRGYAGWGGFIGAALFASIYIRRSRLKFWQIGDIFVPSLALGIVFVKTGCFLNWCCYGIKTDLPWGINIGDFPISEFFCIEKKIFI